LSRAEAPVSLSTACTPALVARKALTDCTVTMTNNTFAPADVDMTATVPKQLQLQPTTAVGGGDVPLGLVADEHGVEDQGVSSERGDRVWARLWTRSFMTGGPRT